MDKLFEKKGNGLTVLLALIFLFYFSSCQQINVSHTHNTPYFTKGNQFEGGVNVGLSGFSTNLAYSPIKYVSIQANAFAYPGVNFNPKYFSNSAEGGIGFYIPHENAVFAISGGYGVSATNWKYNLIIGGPSGYTLSKTKLDSKHVFFHTYLAFKNCNNSYDSTDYFYQGISLRINNYNNKYYYGYASAGSYHLEGVKAVAQSFELTYFHKIVLSKKLLLNFNLGIEIYSNQRIQSSSLNPLLRIGLIFKS